MSRNRRDDGMSGANNIPLGNTRGGGSLAQAASSLGGVSLLNPSYLSGGGPDPGGSHQRGPPPSSSGSGRRSKFGPPAEGKNFLKASVYSAILMLRFTS